MNSPRQRKGCVAAVSMRTMKLLAYLCEREPMDANASAVGERRRNFWLMGLTITFRVNHSVICPKTVINIADSHQFVSKFPRLKKD